jgi:hypothetical protein
MDLSNPRVSDQAVCSASVCGSISLRPGVPATKSSFEGVSLEALNEK